MSSPHYLKLRVGDGWVAVMQEAPPAQPASCANPFSGDYYYQSGVPRYIWRDRPSALQYTIAPPVVDGGTTVVNVSWALADGYPYPNLWVMVFSQSQSSGCITVHISGAVLGTTGSYSADYLIQDGSRYVGIIWATVTPNAYSTAPYDEVGIFSIEGESLQQLAQGHLGGVAPVVSSPVSRLQIKVADEWVKLVPVTGYEP